MLIAFACGPPAEWDRLQLEVGPEQKKGARLIPQSVKCHVWWINDAFKFVSDAVEWRLHCRIIGVLPPCQITSMRRISLPSSAA
jgi:hypothetical protein